MLSKIASSALRASRSAAPVARKSTAAAAAAPSQAVILAAGTGSRLADAFAEAPKCFAPVAGKPILEHSLSSFRSVAAVDDIVIVRGHQGHVFDSQELGAGVTLVDNAQYATADQLQSFVESMAHWPEGQGFYTAYADVVFPDRVLQKLAEAEGDVCVVVDRDFRRTRNGTPAAQMELVSTADGAVTAIGKGLEAGDAEFVGLVKFSAHAKEVLAAALSELSGKFAAQPEAAAFASGVAWKDATLCDLLQHVVSEGLLSVTPVEVFGGWREVDSAADLAAADAAAQGFLTNQRAYQAHVRAMGAATLSEANDLKRPTEIMAREIGVDHGLVRAFIDGEVELDTAHDLVRRISEVYPVPLSSLLIPTDDTEAGVTVTSAADGEATARVLDRPNRDGVRTEYYEYRDAAMSRLAPFRPEWIKELRHVEDNDPYNPDVAMNNGHFMLQTTYFIGPVNFYYEVNGVRHCFEAETGDSNFISPYVPHSFTTRDPDTDGNEAIILAVTFAGRVKSALDDFGRIGGDKIDALCGDARDSSAYEALLARRMAAECLTPPTLAAELAAAGAAPERAQALAQGAYPADSAEIELVAGALNVRPADIQVVPLEERHEVVTIKGADIEARPYPSAEDASYSVKPLSRSPHQPDLKSFDFFVHATDAPGASLECGLHQFIYNKSEHPVTMTWGAPGQERTRVLAPNDSATVAPLVPHAFHCAPGAEGSLFVVRIPGAFTAEVLNEYATYQPKGRARTGRETMRWYQ